MPREQLFEKPRFTNSRTESGCFIQTVEGEGGGAEVVAKARASCHHASSTARAQSPSSSPRGGSWSVDLAQDAEGRVHGGGEGNGPSNKNSQVSASLWH